MVAWQRWLRVLTGGGLALALTAWRAARVAPAAVQVREVWLPLPRLHPAFDGYRIAHLSDIHLDGWMDYDRLRDIIAQVNALEPDLIVFTGDLVTRHLPGSPEALSAVLRELRAPDGVLAVLGNHDHRSVAGPVALRHILTQGGVTVLANDVISVRRGEAALPVAGVDDVVRLRARLDLVLPQLPAAQGAILLVHEPDFADIAAATGRFDLQLSGHSHGGQVILPLLGPLILPRYGQRYPVGAYRIGELRLYTNRGLGVGAFRVRFNCRPEIALLTLAAETLLGEAGGQEASDKRL